MRSRSNILEKSTFNFPCVISAFIIVLRQKAQKNIHRPKRTVLPYMLLTRDINIIKRIAHI